VKKEGAENEHTLFLCGLNLLPSISETRGGTGSATGSKANQLCEVIASNPDTIINETGLHANPLGFGGVQVTAQRLLTILHDQSQKRNQLLQHFHLHHLGILGIYLDVFISFGHHYVQLCPCNMLYDTMSFSISNIQPRLT
jgi:hypothetical protein